MRDNNEIMRIEQITLGTILVNPNLYYQVSDTLNEVMFSSETTQYLCSKLFETIEKYGTVRLNAFAKKVQTEYFGYDDVLGLANLSDFFSFSDNCEKIQLDFITRSEIDLAAKIKSKLESGEHYEDVLSEAEVERGVTLSMIDKGETDRVQDVQEAKDEIYRAVEAHKLGELTGISSGLKDLDKLTSGFHPSDLNILAGRPGMGKTTLCLCIALSSARKGYPVLFFSLEMDKKQLIKKMASIITGVAYEKLRKGNLTEAEHIQINEAMDEIYDLPIYINDRLFDVYKCNTKVKYYKAKYGVQIVFIDYLQLLNAKGYTKEYDIVTAASKELKQVAKKNNLPINLLSQLSRAVETRGGNKRPQLSDLRSSGQIEQDADSVAFIYRPEYYGILEDEEGQSLRGIAEIIYEKNRHGMVDTVKTKFDGAFSDLPDPDFGDFESAQSSIITRSQRMTDDDPIPF